MQAKPRLPITPAILRQLFRAWDQSQDPDAPMLKAAACLAFFGFLRTAEFTTPSQRDFDASTHLTLQDVAIDSRQTPSVIRIHIKHSKTDPFRQGVSIFLGRSLADICPVQSIAQYLAIRGATHGPLFCHSNGNPLSRSSLVRKMRQALSIAGINPETYNGHSFRIGAATTAATKGIEDALIQTLGRWQSTAYLRYVKIPRDQLASVPQALMS